MWHDVSCVCVCVTEEIVKYEYIWRVRLCGLKIYTYVSYILINLSWIYFFGRICLSHHTNKHTHTYILPFSKYFGLLFICIAYILNILFCFQLYKLQNIIWSLVNYCHCCATFSCCFGSFIYMLLFCGKKLWASKILMFEQLTSHQLQKCIASI